MALFSFGKRTDSAFKVRIKEWEKLKGLPRSTQGVINLQGQPFYYHDAESFYITYKEIVVEEIYKFHTSHTAPLIIDCGANMGLSVLYLSQLYPQAHIVAFEPETAVFDILQKNVQQFAADRNIEIYQKAVWESETTLQFFTDHGMGGSVTAQRDSALPVEVQTVRLADFLQQPVDFLKMDIEGAEYTVLKSCGPYLKNVANIFVEYHSYIGKEQKLEEILGMLKNNGFRYHLKQSFSRQRPFVDRAGGDDIMEMAINVFGYKEQNS
jgi:FkbM family methyltransferase